MIIDRHMNIKCMNFPQSFNSVNGVVVWLYIKSVLSLSGNEAGVNMCVHACVQLCMCGCVHTREHATLQASLVDRNVLHPMNSPTCIAHLQ